jgi:hypothetical protein
MKRREFIAGTAALLVSPRHSGAPRRVGSLGGFQNLPILKVFREGLRDHGWIEGKNLIIDYRYFENHPERIPALAAELVALKPDLLIGTNPQATVALKSATATIPIKGWAPRVRRICRLARPIVISGFGTFATCRPTVAMSVNGGRAEVVGTGPNRLE